MHEPAPCFNVAFCFSRLPPVITTHEALRCPACTIFNFLYTGWPVQPPKYNEHDTRVRLFANHLARYATCDVSVHPSCLHLGPLSPPLRGGNGVHGRPLACSRPTRHAGASEALRLCPLLSNRPPFKSRAVPPSIRSAPPHPRFQALLRRRSRLQRDPC